jgi:soluble lytic murein transglycosylase-like protein
MNWRTLLVTMATLAPGQVRADLTPILAETASQMCRQAVAAAERAHGIPPHLLAAIARVESGRRDEATNAFNPWPWTINFDGQGSFYDNRAQAVAAAVAMRPRVTRSIDVGCMQVSLTNHPDAFVSMDQAFDPSSNADYGARFLVQLFAKTGSWPKAVEAYHSATPELGHDYGQKVYAALPEESKLAYAAEPPPIAAGWAATPNRSLLISPFRQVGRVIPQAAALGGEPAGGRTLDSYRASPVRIASRAL